ncbi:MAG: putative iron-sulfur cluster-binding metallochaperone [Pyrinomonadaceae bacterium]
MSTNPCKKCAGQGKPVSRKTILLMLKPDLLEQAMSGSYSFCSARDCPVVYFEDGGTHQFTTDDLRVRVGLKVKHDPIPLCYCFGFEASDMRDEIARTGSTTIPERVSRLIREGLCACDARNPAGVCCLGEVNKVAKLLKSQHSENGSEFGTALMANIVGSEWHLFLRRLGCSYLPLWQR